MGINIMTRKQRGGKVGGGVHGGRCKPPYRHFGISLWPPAWPGVATRYIATYLPMHYGWVS